MRDRLCAVFLFGLVTILFPLPGSVMIPVKEAHSECFVFDTALLKSSFLNIIGLNSNTCEVFT